ncbi:hypothetical protein D3C86_1326340 [compost metagenome]
MTKKERRLTGRPPFYSVETDSDSQARHPLPSPLIQECIHAGLASSAVNRPAPIAATGSRKPGGRYVLAGRQRTPARQDSRLLHVVRTRRAEPRPGKLLLCAGGLDDSKTGGVLGNTRHRRLQRTVLQPAQPPLQQCLAGTQHRAWRTRAVVVS